MNKVFKVGLIGCGHISETYFRAQEYFNNIRIVKCADINMETARKCAIHYNIEAVTVEELLKDKESAPTNQEVPSYVQVIGAIYRNSDPTDIAVTAAGGLVGEVIQVWRPRELNTQKQSGVLVV